MPITINKINAFIEKVKDFGSITVANTLSALISGLFWLYMASIIGPEDYGLIFYLIAVGSIGAAIASLGINNTLIVFGAKKESIHSSLYTISISSSTAVSLILYTFLNNVEISLYVFLFVLFGLATADLLGRKNYRLFSIYVLSQRFLLVILAIIFYHLVGNLGIILGMALSYLPFVYRLRVGFYESDIGISKIKEKVGFMMNNYAYRLSQTFGTQIDKIIILPLLGYTLLGNYQLGVQFLLLANIIPQSAYQYLLPQDSVGISNKKLKKIIVIISACISFFGLFFAGSILTMLFPDYRESQNIVTILSLAIVPLSLNFLLMSEFLGSNKSKIVMMGGLILISVHVFGMLILGGLYSLNGVAVAYVLGALSQSLFFLVMKQRIR